RGIKTTDESQTFTYDALYRLTQAVGVWGTKTYAYDSGGVGVGNPTTYGGLTARSLTFVGQQVMSGTGLSGPMYDPAGNRTHKVLAGATSDYTWTAENRLLTVKNGGVPLASMVYDADGQRVQKIYTPPGGTTVTTTYIGKMYEKRTYSDGSAERHTLH